MDQKFLRGKLEVYSNPCTERLVNIVTGQVVTNKSVNVYSAYDLGMTQMELFEQGWPTSFHETIHKEVTTMAVFQKYISKLRDMNIFDIELIYARAMSLQNSLWVFNTNNLQLMNYLHIHPAFLFGRKCMNEATLKVLSEKFPQG